MIEILSTLLKIIIGLAKLPFLFLIAILEIITGKNIIPNEEIYNHDTLITAQKRTEQSWEIASKVETVDYNIYINSPAWKYSAARLAAITRDNRECSMCSDKNSLEVHHTTYERLGNELITDLITLCKDCHIHTHKIAGKGASTYPPIKHPEK